MSDNTTSDTVILVCRECLWPTIVGCAKSSKERKRRRVSRCQGCQEGSLCPLANEETKVLNTIVEKFYREGKVLLENCQTHTTAS